MKAITIKQPFATLIAEGLKQYEFRTWRTNYRGEILIHAGKSIDKKAMKKFESLGLSYPTGCIIAKVTITDCVIVDDKLRSDLKNENALVYSGIINDRKWNGYGFVIRDVFKIKPIYVKGSLGLWNYSGEIK